MMNRAKNFFESILKVFSPEFYNFEGGSCGGFNTKALGSQNFDLIIFLAVSKSISGKVVAAASPCKIAAHNYRPIEGVFLVGLHILEKAEHPMKSLNHLFFHEFTHILAFSPILYKYFWNAEKNKPRPIEETLAS